MKHSTFCIGLFVCLAVFLLACKKDTPDPLVCPEDNYQGHYIGELAQTVNDPYFNTEIYTNDSCEIFIEFCSDLGFDTRIEISDTLVTIPPQIVTYDNLLTLDSLDYWKLRITGSGSYDHGVITIDYIKESNYYNSQVFQYHSSNSVTLTLQ